MVDLPAPMKPVRTRRLRWVGMTRTGVWGGSVRVVDEVGVIGVSVV